jgi:hypothetical protein
MDATEFQQPAAASRDVRGADAHEPSPAPGLDVRAAGRRIEWPTPADEHPETWLEVLTAPGSDVKAITFPSEPKGRLRRFAEYLLLPERRYVDEALDPHDDDQEDD